MVGMLIAEIDVFELQQSGPRAVVYTLLTPSISATTTPAVCCRAAEGESDELDNTNKSFQEGAFATLYTLTKNRQLDASLRLAALKVVLEFLQVGWQQHTALQGLL
jgi:hypothetical protein